MLRIAIDGACRRNGKPDCVSAGGVFIQHFDEELNVVQCDTRQCSEFNSTNQRGEMMALEEALMYILEQGEDAQIVTDSEYLFNAVTKSWVRNWYNKNWLTASGTPVKNKDLWERINAIIQECEEHDIEINMYHIKGHAIPFGAVTANNLLVVDETGQKLFEAIVDKINSIGIKQEMLDLINELSIKNHGFRLDEESLVKSVAINIVADVIATKEVERADREFTAQSL